MDDFHLSKDGCTIVCDKDFTLGVLDHFIHTSGAEGGSDDISEGYSSLSKNFEGTNL
jgi:hypothetical protein